MHRVLRSIWDEPRPSNPPPPRQWWDWTMVGVLMAGSVIEGVFRPELPIRTISTIVATAVAPLLLWRRSRPLLVIAIAFGVSGLEPAFTGGIVAQNYTLLYMLAIPFSLLRWGSGRAVLIGLAIILAKVLFWLAAGFSSPSNAGAELAVLITTLAVGAAFRYRARARARELDQAKLLERERLARDLHDTVAHHVSAMAIRAQAGLAMAEIQPEAAAEALKLIESEASRALTEMRAMVRLLRDDHPAELTPSPRIADLEQLARTRHGPPVDVAITGEVATVAPPVAAAIYRLAQESVTNARRHARHATRIEVNLTADDKEITLKVSDDGEPGPQGSSGYGLIGMAERAGLLGGTCEAGPNPGRGWTVTATLPRTGSAA